MTYREAIDILEAEDFAIQQEGEILAELGSSAFALYGNAADAMTVAYAELSAQRDREAERAWDARVAEARAFLDAIPVRVTYWSPWRGPTVTLDGSPVPEDAIPF
jgi:hypothetical protein